MEQSPRGWFQSKNLILFIGISDVLAVEFFYSSDFKADVAGTI